MDAAVNHPENEGVLQASRAVTAQKRILLLVNNIRICRKCLYQYSAGNVCPECGGSKIIDFRASAIRARVCDLALAAAYMALASAFGLLHAEGDTSLQPRALLSDVFLIALDTPLREWPFRLVVVFVCFVVVIASPIMIGIASGRLARVLAIVATVAACLLFCVSRYLDLTPIWPSLMIGGFAVLWSVWRIVSSFRDVALEA